MLPSPRNQWGSVSHLLLPPGGCVRVAVLCYGAALWCCMVATVAPMVRIVLARQHELEETAAGFRPEYMAHEARVKGSTSWEATGMQSRGSLELIAGVACAPR